MVQKTPTAFKQSYTRANFWPWTTEDGFTEETGFSLDFEEL